MYTMEGYRCRTHNSIDVDDVFEGNSFLRDHSISSSSENVTGMTSPRFRDADERHRRGSGSHGYVTSDGNRIGSHGTQYNNNNNKNQKKESILDVLEKRRRESVSNRLKDLQPMNKRHSLPASQSGFSSLPIIVKLVGTNKLQQSHKQSRSNSSSYQSVIFSRSDSATCEIPPGDQKSLYSHVSGNNPGRVVYKKQWSVPADVNLSGMHPIQVDIKTEQSPESRTNISTHATESMDHSHVPKIMRSPVTPHEQAPVLKKMKDEYLQKDKGMWTFDDCKFVNGDCETMADGDIDRVTPDRIHTDRVTPDRSHMPFAETKFTQHAINSVSHFGSTGSNKEFQKSDCFTFESNINREIPTGSRQNEKKLQTTTFPEMSIPVSDSDSGIEVVKTDQIKGMSCDNISISGSSQSDSSKIDLEAKEVPESEAILDESVSTNEIGLDSILANETRFSSSIPTNKIPIISSSDFKIPSNGKHTFRTTAMLDIFPTTSKQQVPGTMLPSNKTQQENTPTSDDNVEVAKMLNSSVIANTETFYPRKEVRMEVQKDTVEDQANCKRGETEKALDRSESDITDLHNVANKPRKQGISDADDIDALRSPRQGKSIDSTKRFEIGKVTAPAEHALQGCEMGEESNQTGMVTPVTSDSDQDQRNDVQTIVVELFKSKIGLGFSIDGGRGSTAGDNPITVKRLFRTSMDPNKSVHLLLLRPGDELLSANGRDLSLVSHYVAWNFLNSLPEGIVTLVLRRNHLKYKQPPGETKI